MKVSKIEDFTTYTADDFLTTAPYEAIEEIKDPFQRNVAITIAAKHAKSLGVPFMKMYQNYQRSSRAAARADVYLDNITTFSGQPLELVAGDWEADDSGIRRRTGFGYDEVACVHPIMPIERLVNIDTGTEKLRLAYCRKGNNWRLLTVEKHTLANSSSITTLADHGIAVNSETAKSLIKYLYDIENLNYELIPETLSVSRLGWNKDKGFSPYCGNLVFDGDANFGDAFAAVDTRGDADAWKALAMKVRDESPAARVVLAASFASVLIGPLRKLPFFVHIWGPSGNGKTVTLMLAASVWGDPEPGTLVKSLSGTDVGLERMAAFFNSLPVLLDELQTRSEHKRRESNIVYLLSGGQGKPRGTRNGGIERIPTWRNTIITTGEQPLIEDAVTGGAINRILSIYQSASIFSDAPAVADSVRQNFGHSGRAFVEAMSQPGQLVRIQKDFDFFYQYILSSGSSTEKQAMAAAIVATADRFANEHVFNLDIDDSYANTQLFLGTLLSIVASAADTDDIKKAHEYILGWAASNGGKFAKWHPDAQSDCWGESDGNGGFYIVASVLQKAVTDAGMSCRKIFQGLADRGLIEARIEYEKRVFTIKRSINSARPRCIHVLASADFDYIDDE